MDYQLEPCNCDKRPTIRARWTSKEASRFATSSFRGAHKYEVDFYLANLSEELHKETLDMIHSCGINKPGVRTTDETLLASLLILS
jgi:hypothetical protein